MAIREDHDIDEGGLRVTRPERTSAGLTAVRVALSRAVAQMGAERAAGPCCGSTRRTASTARAARGPNRTTARTRPSSARTARRRWPRRPRSRRVGPEFFAAHSIAELRGHERLLARPAGPADASPMYSRAGATHYAPICWDDAFALVADAAARRCDARTEAVFYTSRPHQPTRPRSSTSCSCARSAPTTCPTARTCATSRRGSALTETIGIGKGTVSLDDIARGRPDHRRRARTPAPTTRGCCPRWRRPSAAARTIIAVNPLPEAGLLRFKNPQTVTRRARRRHEARRPVPADPGRRRPGAVPGDRQAPARRADGATPPATVLDRAFIDAHTSGFDDVRGDLRGRSTGRRAARGHRADRERDRRRVAERCRASDRVDRLLGDGPHPAQATRWRRSARSSTSCCCAATSAGRAPGVCPVRGHCNVQGDRTMGICEQPSRRFLDALDAEFDFDAAARARATTPSTPSAPCATARSTCLRRHGRQLRRRPRPTPT